MSKRQLTEEEKLKYRPTFLKEVWLLVENVKSCSGSVPRFEVVCVDPKVASEEGHDISPNHWIYIQPDGDGVPRLVMVRDLSRSREIMLNRKKIFERDRNTWTTNDQEPTRRTNKISICKTSTGSIRKVKRDMKSISTNQLQCSRRGGTSDFVLAKRKRGDRIRQLDGVVPSCSGMSSRQLCTPTPPRPSSTPPRASNMENEYASSSFESASSSSTDEDEKRFKRLIKSIAKYSGHLGRRSEKSMHRSRRSFFRGNQHKRHLMTSTPNPGFSQNVVKVTFDQATQTDIPMEVEGPPQEEVEDAGIVEGQVALLKMGTLLETIKSQFNTITQSLGFEGLNLDLSDFEIEGDTPEEETNSEVNDDSQSNSSRSDSTDQQSEPQAEDILPQPVRRMSPPVRAVASPSLRRIPTPQQPVVGSVERTDRQRQSSNESGDHFVTTSNVMGPGPSKKKMVKVRRASAQTTNKIERAPGEDLVPIGNGRAMVPSRLLEEIDWNSYTQATRQLLQAVFPRRVLATHSLTGKQSPAFMNKPPKKQLDSALVEDVVIVVTLRCGVTERLVRNCITIKCTDEAKLYRNRQQCRQGRLQGSDQENVAPNQTTDDTTENSSGDS